MTSIARTACTCALLLALAACHHEGKGSDQRTASGEVLAGSLSDSMIPYESLKSQPPLAPRSADKPGRAAATDAAPDDATSAAPQAVPAEAAPAPAASPVQY